MYRDQIENLEDIWKPHGWYVAISTGSEAENQ